MEIRSIEYLTPADQLGHLLAQIAALTKQADAIKDSFKDEATSGGDKVFVGSLFKATVIEANRKSVDYAALVADAALSKKHVVSYVNQFFKEINANEVAVAAFHTGLNACTVDNEEVAEFTKTTAVFSVKSTSL